MKKRFKVSVISLLLAIVLIFQSMPFAELLNAMGEESVIEIGNADQLMEQIVLSANGKTFEGMTIRLTDDITLTDDDYTKLHSTYSSLGLASFTFNIREESPFMGEFDGNGKTISSLRYDINGTSASTESDTGLFAFTNNAYIHDLIIKDSVIDSDYRGGIVAGFAQNTVFKNISVKDSTLTLYCYNVVLTLGSDGGLSGGILVGNANFCYIYNCEANGCTVSTNTTSGVEAISGKGLYLGGIVGDLYGGVLEYCRVQDSIKRKSDGTIDVTRKSLIKIHYDVAVGALGGITAYAGGLVGEMQNGAFCVDSFSTADMDVYTATYVSVGGGNSGHIGGVAAAVRGSRCEIKRCHFAGEAVSKQYNAILVIPIIQNNKNISGLVAKFDGGSISNSYFKYELNPDVDMLVLGDDVSTSEYGPKDNTTYANQDFWEGRGYDFNGTILRENYYEGGSSTDVYDHYNKWVMDTYLDIPVHGNSVAATFDFPDSGEIEIDYTELIGSSVTSDKPLSPAIQGFTTMEDTINITMHLNSGYRVNKWYKDTDYHNNVIENFTVLEELKKTELSSDENHIINNSLTDAADATLTITGSINNVPVISDSDIYIADVQANVVFKELDGTIISTEWYDYLDQLPDIVPTQKPSSASAIFLGWTTTPDSSGDGTVGYEKISSGILNSIPIYKTGKSIEKTMVLYPVFTDLITNVKVAIEGHNTEDVTTRTDSVKVGDVSVSQEIDSETGLTRYYVELKNFVGESAGYRFAGWYINTDKTSPDYINGNRVSMGDTDGEGNEYSNYRYYLDDYDLTQYDSESNQFLIVAKLEYLVTYRVQEVGGDLEGPYKDEITYAERWEAYNNNFENLNGPDFVDANFSHWEDANGNTVNSSSIIKKPLTVYAKTDDDGYGSYSITIHSDFPGAASELNNTGLKDTGWEISYTLADDDYNFIFWSRERLDSTAGRALSTSNPFPYSGNSNTSIADILFTAHFTADVNFYDKNGNVKAATTRRYNDNLFIFEDDGVSDSIKDEVSEWTYTYTYIRDGAQKGNYTHIPLASPDDEDMYIDGYYFLGWINKNNLTDDEWNYIYDLHSTDLYCTSDISHAIGYIMSGDEICTEPADIYPVYIKYGTIDTQGIVKVPDIALTNNLVNSVNDPDYVISEIGEKLLPSEFTQNGYVISGNTEPTYYIGKDGNVKITVTAEDNKTNVTDDSEQKFLVDEIVVYKNSVLLGSLQIGDNIIDNSKVVVTQDNSNGQWVFDYTVEPGNSYQFIAYYEPLVLVYNISDSSQETSIRNTGDVVGEQPKSQLENHIFVGWTDEEPSGTWYTLSQTSNIVTESDFVTQTMELWPVFKTITISVNSNIDDELGDTSHRSGTWGYDYSQEYVTLSAQETVGEYTFMGWYTSWDVSKSDIEAETSAEFVTDKSEYQVIGDSLISDKIYTAVYKKVYTIKYHGVTGDAIETIHIAGDNSRSFVTQTVNDNGTEDTSDDETIFVPIDQDAFLNIMEELNENQTFVEWYWLKNDSSKVYWDSFYNNSAVESMADASTRIMNLYPIIIEANAFDSNNESIDVLSNESISIVDGKEVIVIEEADVELSFSLNDTENILDVYLNYPAKDKDGVLISESEYYAQPNIKIVAVKKEIGIDGTYSESNVDMIVNLYEEKAISSDGSGVIQINPILQQEIISSVGNSTVFNLYGQLTIEKIYDDTTVPFVFKIKEYDSENKTYTGKTRTVTVNSGSGVTVELPCGYYVIEEDSAWAWNYDTVISFNGNQINSKSLEFVLSIGSDGTVDRNIVSEQSIIVPNEVLFENKKNTTLSNWFYNSDRITNIFD